MQAYAKSAKDQVTHECVNLNILTKIRSRKFTGFLHNFSWLNKNKGRNFYAIHA